MQVELLKCKTSVFNVKMCLYNVFLRHFDVVKFSILMFSLKNLLEKVIIRDKPGLVNIVLQYKRQYYNRYNFVVSFVLFSLPTLLSIPNNEYLPRVQPMVAK